MASSLTLKDHLSGVAPAALDRACSDENLKNVALRLAEWEGIAPSLGLEEEEVEEIKRRGRRVRERSLKVLRKWRQKFGEQATYRCLISTLWDHGQAALVERICQLVRATTTLSAPQAHAVSDIPQQQIVPDPSIMKVYLPLIKSRYNSILPGVMVQFPSPMTHTYFNVTLVKTEKLEEESACLDRTKLAMDDRIKEAAEMRTPVEIENLFKLDRKKKKVILIEGPPGCGKTILSWNMCKKWVSGELFQEFDLVVYVQLRDPAVQTAQSIAGLFPRRNDKMGREVFAEIEAKSGEGVLFVLDGWDELPEVLPQDSPLLQLIESSPLAPLQKSAVIITTRPEASGDLDPLASSRLELVGFAPKSVRNYFIDSLSGDSEPVRLVTEQVNENTAVESSCSIPLFTTILTTLFVVSQLPSTLTGMFLCLIRYCIIRHCISRADIKLRYLTTLDVLPPILQKSFDSLCALALHGMLGNQIAFSEDECMSYPDFMTLSLLDSFVCTGSTRMYRFVHLSIQEMLAARRISKLPADKQKVIFHSLFHRQQFLPIFRFYTGLTELDAPEMKAILREMVSKYRKDRSEQSLMVVALESLLEVEDPKLYRLVAEELKGHQLSLLDPGPISCTSLGCLLPWLSPPSVHLYDLEDQRIELLMKALSKSYVDRVKSSCKGRFVIKLSFVALDGFDGLYALTQILSSSYGVCQASFSFRHLHLSPLVVLSRICESMAQNSSVRSLELQNLERMPLSNTLPGKRVGSALYEMLEQNKTLETLKLICFPVGRHAASIAKGLIRNTSLKKLVLVDCEIGDYSAKSIAEMLTNNTTLEILDIRHNRVSTEGVRCLAEALKRNTTLRVFRLDYCTICSDLESLAVAFTVNKTLRELGDPICNDSVQITTGELAAKLTANGVLQQLLSIAIERLVSEFGVKEAAQTLRYTVEEWNSLYSDMDLEKPVVVGGE